jgi:hypothetical protein
MVLNTLKHFQDALEIGRNSGTGVCARKGNTFNVVV